MQACCGFEVLLLPPLPPPLLLLLLLSRVQRTLPLTPASVPAEHAPPALPCRLMVFCSSQVLLAGVFSQTELLTFILFWTVSWAQGAACCLNSIAACWRLLAACVLALAATGRVHAHANVPSCRPPHPAPMSLQVTNNLVYLF